MGIKVRNMAPGIATTAMPGIAAVERDTGVPKDTLRMWERRYGFPAPLRDANGERLYPTDQVEKLRLIRRLLDSGYRPGKIVPLPQVELVRLTEEVSSAPRAVKSQIETGAVDSIDRLLHELRVPELIRHEMNIDAGHEQYRRVGVPCVVGLIFVAIGFENAAAGQIGQWFDRLQGVQGAFIQRISRTVGQRLVTDRFRS